MRTYEQLRAQVICGQARAEGLAVIVYHGMLRGLSVILAEGKPANEQPVVREPVARALPRDPELVRVLANMLLRAQTEVMHVC